MSTPATPSAAESVRKFNTNYRVGVAVRFTFRPSDPSTKKHSITEGPALVHNGEACVPLRDCVHNVPLSRVEILP